MIAMADVVTFPQKLSPAYGLSLDALDIARSLRSLCEEIESADMPLVARSEALAYLITVGIHLKSAVEALHNVEGVLQS